MRDDAARDASSPTPPHAHAARGSMHAIADWKTHKTFDFIFLFAPGFASAGRVALFSNSIFETKMQVRAFFASPLDDDSVVVGLLCSMASLSSSAAGVW